MQHKNRTETSSVEIFCEISNKYVIVFSLSTGLETALADVVSQLVEEIKSMVNNKQQCQC